MSWLDVFKRKRHTFTDEDRTKSKAVRLEADLVNDRIEFLQRKRDRLRAEYKAQELEEEIADMEDELHGVDEDEPDMLDSPDAMFMSLISKAMSGQPASSVMPQTSPIPQKLVFTDDQLLEYKRKIPSAMLKKLRKMSDDELITLGKQYSPDLFAMADDETITRAIRILKS